jgi:diacylglycerol kinase
VSDMASDAVMFIASIVVVGAIILAPSFFEKRKK